MRFRERFRLSDLSRGRFWQGFWWVIGGSIGYFIIQPILNLFVDLLGGVLDVVKLMNFLKTGSM